MSISVQQLVQTAFQNCSLIGDGESVDGTAYGTTAHDGALGLLNNLLSELNNQQYITQATYTIDLPVGETMTFCGSDWHGFVPPNWVRVDAPDRLFGVSRKIGDRWIPLHSCDRQQIDQRTKKSLPTSWAYEIVPNTIPAIPFGILYLDTTIITPVRIFYPMKLELKTNDPFLGISDAYFDLLLNGLCVKLCVKYKLTDYLPIFEQQFKQAKNLIKRSNATQRMLQRGDLVGGYDDSFYNGLGGVGW